METSEARKTFLQIANEKNWDEMVTKPAMTEQSIRIKEEMQEPFNQSILRVPPSRSISATCKESKTNENEPYTQFVIN